MGTSELPKVDMLNVAKNSRRQRRMISGFAPDIGLAIIDYGRNLQLDTFYLRSQNQRDFYRDPSGKVRKEPFFNNSPCTAYDKASASFLAPTVYHRDKQPVVYPYAYKKDFLNQYNLVGTYAEVSDIRYKR